MKSSMLSGKTALVTGSTSGIGLGIARSLAQEGANIVFNGFGDAQQIEKLHTDLAREFGVRCRVVAEQHGEAGRCRVANGQGGAHGHQAPQEAAKRAQAMKKQVHGQNCASSGEWGSSMYGTPWRGAIRQRA